MNSIDKILLTNILKKYPLQIKIKGKWDKCVCVWGGAAPSSQKFFIIDKKYCILPCY